MRSFSLCLQGRALEEEKMGHQAGKKSLAEFITNLVTDQDALSAYLADSDAAMAAAGLDGEQKAVLRADSFATICDYLSSGARPLDTGQPGG